MSITRILESNQHTLEDGNTFNELVEEYKKWAERQRSFSSKIHLINQLCEDFGNVLLKNFNTKLLEQYQTKRLQGGKRQAKDSEGQTVIVPNEPATVNRLQATLSHTFTKGYEWEMLSEDILKRVRKVKMLPETAGACGISRMMNVRP